jgi:hypothetical protein
LFKFRNDLAHGKNQILNTDDLRDSGDNVDMFLGEPPKTDWEKMITWASVNQVRGDVEVVMSKLHAAADPTGGHPVFSAGISSHSAKLEES